MTAGSLDRSRPPRPGPPRPYAFPSFRRRRLPNGLTLVLCPVPRLPLISLELITPAGAWHDPPDEAGLATLTAALLDDGTRTRSAPEIAAFVERLGGSLSTGADWDAASISLGLLSRHLSRGLEILGEVATTPTFPEEEVERVRQQRRVDLVRRRDQPAALANLCCSRAVYGGSAYGRSILGCEETVGRIARSSIERFYRRRMKVRGASLMAVGDLDLDTFEDQAARAMGDWPATEAAAPPQPSSRQLRGVEVHLVDRPSAVQTELRIGHAGIPRNHADFIAVKVMNTLLGGKFTSRINLNLRERHGLTYGAHSHFAERLGPGPFLVSAAVATEATRTAVDEILVELRRIQEEPVEEAELEDAKSYLLGVFPYTVETIDGLARRLEELLVFELGDDYFQRYPDLLERVDRGEVLRVAREHLRPDQIAVVAVGEAGRLETELADLGPVRRWEPTALV